MLVSPAWQQASGPGESFRWSDRSLFERSPNLPKSVRQIFVTATVAPNSNRNRAACKAASSQFDFQNFPAVQNLKSGSLICDRKYNFLRHVLQIKPVESGDHKRCS